MDKVIEISIELILFLIASYFLFYKSYLKALGNKIAELETKEQLTSMEENVKNEFREKIEDYKAKINENFSTKIEQLKSTLAKENLSYQINLVELTKIRFVKIETLWINLIELQEYIKANMFAAETSEQFENNKANFLNHYKKADLSRRICHLYISDELAIKIVNVLNNSYGAYISFVRMYQTDPKKLGDISIFDRNTQMISQKLTKENFEAYESLNDEIEKFPKVLKELSDELKKNILLKEIEI